MKAEELRIGNLVDFNGEILPISSINEDNTVRLLKGIGSIGCFRLGKLKPIPITEDLLEKLEFERSQTLPYRWHKYGSIEIVFDLDDFSVSLGEGWSWLPNKVEYVHEMQNLLNVLKLPIDETKLNTKP